MNPLLARSLEVFAASILWTTGFAALLSIVGRISKSLSETCTRAPVLDLIVALLTWIPWPIAYAFAGWTGLAAMLLGQVIGLYLWCIGHELANREASRGPRIVKFINRSAGRWQNHLALWVTVIALPGFWMIRFCEVVSYWPLVVLLNFPKYKQSEWVNVSRQKFGGLVGHDLIWCLYCDWMTGVYSLGAEMLRNVESFWCPIRFYEGKKCENCRIDFPDIANGWVEPGKTMTNVVEKMEEMYGDGRREWFGHPARLTVRGAPIAETSVTPPASAKDK